ncbi:MAG: hypothetical protein WKG07_49220 [Hymenobacter sp.]
MQRFARCIDDTARPAGYIGDWPTAGRVYPVRMLPHARTGQQRVHVLGFLRRAPLRRVRRPPLRADSHGLDELISIKIIEVKERHAELAEASLPLH